MKVNPKSFKNLKPGANAKNAVRVTLTLKPKTVHLLKAQGNMSEAVDKLIELCCLGLVQHDGCLNPPDRETSPVREAIRSDSHHVHSVNQTFTLPGWRRKPEYWTLTLTRQQMVDDRGVSARKLDKMPVGTAIADSLGMYWWKIAIDRGNANLRPLGSKADFVWGR